MVHMITFSPSTVRAVLLLDAEVVDTGLRLVDRDVVGVAAVGELVALVQWSGQDDGGEECGGEVGLAEIILMVSVVEVLVIYCELSFGGV